MGLLPRIKIKHMIFPYIPICGIYRITCLPENKSYIGKSKNIGNRWIAHMSTLNDRTHGNSELQRVYDTYGVNGLSFQVVEVVPEDCLQEAEARWIESIGIDNLYNVARVSYTGNTDVSQFVDFIKSRWLVPSNNSRTKPLEYRIWSQEDKDEIVEMALRCRLFALCRSDTKYTRVIKLMESQLGYVIQTGRAILGGRRTIYKLITAYDPAASTYVPPYPAPDSTPVSTNE